MGFLYLFVALSPCLWLVNKILPFHLDEENNYYVSCSEGLDSCQRTNQGSGIIYITGKPDRQHQLSIFRY